MPQKPDVILQELKKGVFRPFYFLQGEEPFFIDQITEYIENHALEPGERSFNQLVLYGKDTTLGNVIVQARRFPMMAQRQLVLVKEAQEISALNNKEGQDLMMKYLDNIVESTILVFAYKYKKLDGRKELPKILDKKATLVESERIPDYKLKDWISGYIVSQKFHANASAAELLADHLGNDLSRIANELEKLKITLPEGSEITKDIIHEKIGISKEFNGIEFQQALATRNMAKALQIAQYFVANPKASNLIPNLSLLFNFFLKVLIVHTNPKAGNDELARLLGLRSEFFLKDYKAAKNLFSYAQVLHVLHQIRLADGYSKGIDSGQREEESIYKDLILQIVRC
jgi:DNA polymerase-3 subunit delta